MITLDKNKVEPVWDGLASTKDFLFDELERLVDVRIRYKIWMIAYDNIDALVRQELRVQIQNYFSERGML